ncbi:NUDIX hydrolase [Guptibacillus algicola]|uniref:NUDIX hydrolase n=1 Tax=Guptibacillus algicola TaxID=225844 RepID=UPI001CD2E0C7|nr:NUDIX hydrolase [Alkalihalobacillus algicola]MCA0986723.1 NUDIX hydrolase [Alkalihalobacillus algicola]
MGYVEELRSLVGKRPLILVGSVVIICNKEGSILLQQRNEKKERWGLPGGLMEPGESTEETAIREAFEETGLSVQSLTLFQMYSGQEFFTIADNGDEFYSVTAAYYTNHYTGTLISNKEESLSYQFFRTTNLPDNMVLSHRKMIMDYMTCT